LFSTREPDPDYTGGGMALKEHTENLLRQRGGFSFALLDYGQRGFS
jgi:hypothetical protein